jgi:hypothetical protein
MDTPKLNPSSPKWNPNPRGRKPGSTVAAFEQRVLTKRIPSYMRDFAAEIIKSNCKLPLMFLIETMNNDTVPLDIRVDCAKAASPYIHRKMPIVVDMPAEQNTSTLIINAQMDRLADLTDDELASFLALTQRVAKPRITSDGDGSPEEEQDQEVLSGQGTVTEGVISEAPGVLSGGGGQP